MKTQTLPIVAAFAALLAQASAQITYVDASGANMTRLDGTGFTPSTSGNVYNDSNWSLRTAVALASSDTSTKPAGAKLSLL